MPAGNTLALNLLAEFSFPRGEYLSGVMNMNTSSSHWAQESARLHGAVVITFACCSTVPSRINLPLLHQLICLLSHGHQSAPTILLFIVDYSQLHALPCFLPAHDVGASLGPTCKSCSTHMRCTSQLSCAHPHNRGEVASLQAEARPAKVVQPDLIIPTAFMPCTTRVSSGIKQPTV